MDTITKALANDIASTQNALGVVAKWISQEEGVNIHWSRTNEVPVADLKNKVLTIPTIAESDMLDDDSLWVVRAHIYHEAGHIAETTIDERVKIPSIHTIANALEDRRMEHIMASRHIGCGVAFRKALAHYNHELSARFEEAAEQPLQGKEARAKSIMEALMACSFEVENIIPGWSLSNDAAEVHDLIKADFDQVFTCKDTSEIVDLAIKIWEKIKDNDEEKDQQEQQQSQDGQSGDNQQSEGQDGQSDNQDGQNDQSDDNQQSDDGEGDSEQSDGENGKSKKNQKGNGKSESDNGSEDEDGDSDDSDGDSESDSDEGDDDGSNNGKSKRQNGQPQNDSEGDEDGDSENGKRKGSKTIKQTSNGNKSENGNADQSGGGEGGGDGFDELEKALIEALEEACKDYSQEPEKRADKSLAEALEAASENYSRDAIEGQAFKKIIDEQLLVQHGKYTSCRINDRHDMIVAKQSNRSEYKDELESCSTGSALVARALEEYLRAITRTKMLHAQRRGKLDERRFAALAKGLSKEVFKRMSDRRELDTAVEIILDESGSMDEYRVVRQAIMIISEALNRVGIPFEITGGTTIGGNFPCGFTRGNPIRFRHYKTFRQDWESSRPALMQTGAFYNYIDGEMLEFAAARLMARPEKRKIVFSFSDGCPCGGESWDQDTQLGVKLMSVCEDCRKHGIEVYSFGIQTEAPSQYYGKENSIVLRDPQNMGEEIAQGVTRIFTGGHFYMASSSSAQTF